MTQTLSAIIPGRRATKRIRRIAETQCETWFERDRAHVALKDADGHTLFELWDDDVREAIEDGFLNPRDYHCSLFDYAVHRGIVEA